METCDQCGPAVQAKERALLPSGRCLTYCAHCAHCATANMVGLIRANATLAPIEPACVPQPA